MALRSNMEAINKTLNLDDFKKPSYASIVSEIKDLLAIFDKNGLRFTTYQAEFNTGWGRKEDIWFKRKLWEISTIALYADLHKDYRILDCGGASTIFSYYLSSKGYRVDTVDIDWRNYGIIENANLAAKVMNWDMHNIYADMAALPYRDEIFDRVFSICVLEHLPFTSQLKAVREMSRVLKTGGILGLTFDYGPYAFGEKYRDVKDINSRIIMPSGLNVFGNIDYQENAWFKEQSGKTWGCLFLQKAKDDKAGKNCLLICTRRQSRVKVKIKDFLTIIKNNIKGQLCRVGIRRDSKLYLFLIRKLYESGFIKLKNPGKLHLGCGSRLLPGWTNIDMYNGDVRLDVLKGLPIKGDSVDFIYHAHFIEHFDVQDNLKIFKECFRVFHNNSVLRILYPDLRKHCQLYLNGDLETLCRYKAKGTIKFEPEDFKYNSLTEWFNKGMYDFGHKFHYDFETIEAIARSAGFTKIYGVEHGRSEFKDLTDIDYYPDTDSLFSIVEIRK